MPRTLLSFGLVSLLSVGCTPTVIFEPAPTSGSNGSTNASSTAGTGGSTAGTGGSTAGTGGSTAGSSTAGTGASTAGTGSSTAGTGSSTAGTGSSTAGTGASTAGTGSSTAGTGSSTAGTGGSTAGTGGSTAGTGGTSGGGPLIVGPGAYDITTQYNFLDALPTDVENAVKLALEFTDSPGNFLLDQADKIPVIKYVIDALNLFSGIRDTITMAIDEYIDRWSGGMVTTMHNLSQDVEMALRGLKSQNHLVLAKPDASGNMVAADTLVELVFTYQGVDYSYPQGANANTTAHSKGLQLSIDAHTYDKGVRVGGMLVDLIDNIALPQLTGVNSLGELLNQLVDCGGVGTAVWGYIANICIGNLCVYQYITGDDITKLCQNALDAAGRAIENQLSQLDAPGMMSMSDGSCLALENKGHTGHADTLSNGKWSLTLPVGVGNMTLPGTFTGVLGPDASGR